LSDVPDLMPLSAVTNNLKLAHFFSSVAASEGNDQRNPSADCCGDDYTKHTKQVPQLHWVRQN
jgi:hypothetical protein